MTLSAVHTRSDAYPTRLAEETWLERKDPVTWGMWSPQAPLTRAQTEEFDKNGFLILKNVFSPAEVARLQEESRRLRSGGHQSIPRPRAARTSPRFRSR